MRISIPTWVGLTIKYMSLLIFTPISLGLILALADEHIVEINNDAVGRIVVWAWLALLVGFIVKDLLVYIPRIVLVRHRAKTVMAKLPKKAYSQSSEPIKASPVFDALETADDGGSAVFQVTGPNWRFTDYRFDIYREAKKGRYLSKHVYYSVIEISLPRKLPHIVFDSKKARGRQLYFNFDKNQRIALEGNFSTYFDTYFPAHYQIDLLSIITPEVMEVLLSAKDFDIEIYNDQLRLYAPLLRANRVADAIHTGISISKKLMNNINTYSDNRLAANKRKDVHIYGYRIQTNFKKAALGIAASSIFFIAFGIFGVFEAATSHNWADTLGLLVIGIFCAVVGLILLAFAIITLAEGFAERNKRTKIAKK